MISRLSEITRPGKTPAIKSFGMETDWKTPYLSTASGGGCMPSAAIPNITIGIDGGMMIPRLPDDAVIAEASPLS